MKIQLLVLSLILLCSTTGISQNGDYYITHYTPSGKADPSANFAMVQHPDGIISLANRSGILQYDGRNWELFASGGTPVSLANGAEGVYVAGVFGVGFYPYTNAGDFKVIHADSLVSNIQQIEVIDKKLYALSSDWLYIFNTEGNTLINSIQIRDGYFQKLLVVEETPLIISTKGNYRVKNEKLVFEDNLPQEKYSFAISTETYSILGTEDGKMLHKTETGWKHLDIDPGEYKEILQHITFLSAISITDEQFAIATLSEGLLIIDASNNKVEKVINQHHGLPDNELFFLSADSRGGIWTGHAYGVSRIDTSLPFEVYNNFPGLEGNLQTVLSNNNELYVGTSTGLYQLDQIKDYDEIVYFVEQARKVREEESLAEDKTKSKGLFSFLKRRKDDKNETVAEEPESKYESVWEQRTRKQLSSIKYVYKKNNFIKGKVRQLLAGSEEIIAVTLDGLFVVQEENEARLLTNIPVKHAWIDNSRSYLIANTYNGQLLTYEKKGENWKGVDHFVGFQDFILDIFQDSRDRIWFVSANEVYWINYSDGEIYAGEEIPFHNPYLHPTYIIQNNTGDIEIKNQSGIWRYDEVNRKLLKLDSPITTERFVKNDTELWEYKQDKWIGTGDYENLWLNLFDDIKFIERDENEHLFFITEGNELLKISEENKKGYQEKAYPLVIRSVRENGQPISQISNLKFIKKQSELMFEVIQPEFSGVIDIKYQYRVKGLSDKWSEWSADNNQVYLPFLPEGDYELEVRTRNDFKEDQNMASIPFKVVPPYWQRPWFYAFEFSVLAVLLFITINLNHNSSKYRLVNKLLAFLTLILIIEFIQVSAESNFATDFSPVSAFFIQVVIALIVLPVEGFLRRIIIRDKKMSLMKYLGFKKSKA